MNINTLHSSKSGEIYSSDRILVQRITHELFGAVTMTPCKEQYGDRQGDMFTCLNPDVNHGHVVLADNTMQNEMSIFPACIESKEFLADVLNAIARQGHISADAKAILLKRESGLLKIERMTPRELAIKNSPKEFAKSILSIQIPLYVPG